MTALRQAWEAFNRASRAFGHFMSRNVVAPALYYLLGLLFTWPARLPDPLHLRLRTGSLYYPREAEIETPMQRAGSMY